MWIRNSDKKMFAPIGVVRSRERDPLPLPSGQVDSSLADLGLVASRQHVQIVFQVANRDRVIVALGIKLFTKQNIFLKGSIHDPRLLTDVSARALPQDMALRHSQLSQSGQQQAGFAAAYVTANADQFSLRCPEMYVVKDFDIFGLLHWLIEAFQFSWIARERRFPMNKLENRFNQLILQKRLLWLIFMNWMNTYFFLSPIDLSVCSFMLSQTKVPLAMATACDLTIGFDAWQLPSSNSNTLCTDCFVSRIIYSVDFQEKCKAIKSRVRSTSK